MCLSVTRMVPSTALLGAALVLAGCGEESDPISKVDSLRILAVDCDAPFAAPGSQPELEMLVVDGSPKALGADGTPRPVQTLWLGSCVNPAGDSYAECFPSLHRAVAELTDEQLASGLVPEGIEDGSVGFGEHFSARIPEDVITSRPQPKGIVEPYGVVMVFYAACAGELHHAVDADKERDLPVRCLDPETGEELGQEDFEFGYYPIYAYDELRNARPVIERTAIAGSTEETACDAAADCGDEERCGSAGHCIPVVAACHEDKAKDCPEIALELRVSKDSAELATSAFIEPSFAPTENLWVNFYSQQGSFERSARVVHESGSGWTADYSGRWRAKVEPNTEVRLYAVVRDSRGGVTWVSRDVFVR